MNYLSFSDFLMKRYHKKIYKLPIHLKVTCPNRDGTIGTGGCIFCSDEGAGFELQSEEIPIAQQLKQNASYIGEKYKVEGFIPYLQNFTNTYMPLDEFKKVIEQLNIGNTVAISVSTRPDCVTTEHLEILKTFKDKTGLDIILECGLQTVNYKTLKKINRGHTLAEFMDTTERAKSYGFLVGVHLILNLPWDDNEDAIEAAKILSALNVDIVKLHSLYILKNTPLAELYAKGEITIIKPEEYIKRCAIFTEHLKEDIAIERFFGRAPEELCLFENRGRSWRFLFNELDKYFEENHIIQGSKCNYLNGSAYREKYKK